MAEYIQWTVDMEVNLFHAMRGHKPVGVNRFFHMMCIVNKMNACHKPISSEEIWKHLTAMYDLNALNESEVIPFSNTEAEFVLPIEEYEVLKSDEFPRVNFEKNPQKQEHSKQVSESTPITSKTSSKPNTVTNTPSSISATPTGDGSKRKRTRHTPNMSNTTPDQPSVKRRR